MKSDSLLNLLIREGEAHKDDNRTVLQHIVTFNRTLLPEDIAEAGITLYSSLLLENFTLSVGPTLLPIYHDSVHLLLSKDEAGIVKIVILRTRTFLQKF